ncbi:MAG TPA: hypothetical protein PKW64_11420, partial [Segatella copri]|nr:hypothetical protein [Segatella copri]
MKIDMKQVKEKIAGFIFDLIIESGSKSKFFRKYTNHRFRKQYERWEGNAYSLIQLSILFFQIVV